MRTTTSVAILICWLGPVGCGPPAETPATVARDSAGVRVVESRAPRSSEPPWSVGEVLVEVGGEGTELASVAGAVRLSDGRIVVADEGNAEVRWFSPSGEPIGSIGGRGDGPGEFRLITGLGATAADSVWVYDFGHARLTWLAPDGGPAGSIPIRPPLGSGGVVGRLPDGGFLLAEAWSAARVGEATQPGLDRRPAAYVRYAPDGTARDTVGLFPGREVLLRLENGRAMMGTVPFARAASHALLPGGELVVGDQVDHRLSVHDAEGELLRLLRWRGPDLAIGEDEVDAWKERQVEAAEPRRRAEVRAYLADVPVPDTRPAYSRLLAAPSGALWVASYAHPGETPERWDVLAADGGWLGTVPMPVGFLPLQIGEGWVLGTERDAVDAEHVVVRRLMER